MAWTTLDGELKKLDQQKKAEYLETTRDGEAQINHYLKREKTGKKEEKKPRFSEKEVAEAAKWLQKMNKLGLSYDAKIAGSPIYFDSEHRERSYRERKALRDAAKEYMGRAAEYEKNYLDSYRKERGLTLNREKTAEEAEQEQKRRESVSELVSSREKGREFTQALVNENRKLRQRLLFGVNNEGMARKYMEQLKALDQQRRNAITAINFITKGRYRDLKKYNEENSQTLTEAYNQLLQVKAGYQALREEVKKNTTKGYEGDNPAEMEQLEEKTYMDGVNRYMQEEGMDLEKAENAFEEERLKAKRPYTLLHLDEVRKKKKEDYKKVYENNFLSLDNQDLMREGLIDKPLTVDEADQIIGEYLNDVFSQQNSYQIRVPNCEIMGLIMQSGRFRTQVENIKSFGATNNVEGRKQLTSNFYGSDKKLLPITDYEVYGYLSHGDHVKECQTNNQNNIVGNGVGQYGQIIVTLKKDRMKYRTTVTDCDSLDGQTSVHPIMMEDKKDSSIMKHMAKSGMLREALKYKKKKEAGEDVSEMLSLDHTLQTGMNAYVELQFHGGVSLEDIESVTLNTNYVSNKKGFVPDQDFPPELLETLKKNGIKAQVVRGDKLEVK